MYNNWLGQGNINLTNVKNAQNGFNNNQRLFNKENNLNNAFWSNDTKHIQNYHDLINQNNPSNYNNNINANQAQYPNFNNNMEELINENTNLKNIIKNLKEELNKTKESQNLLENQLAKAKEELQKYQSKNYIQTGDSMMSINPGDKILAINFVSMGSQDIGHFNLICKNTDLFVTLEARLYEVYPQFKDFDTYFAVNTKRIKRFKTVEENGIKSNDIISLFTIE